jgi:hypothetical protein
MRNLLILLCTVTVTVATILSTDDNTLSHVQDTPIDESSLPTFQELNRYTHPITNPNQVSHWVVGSLWKLPINSLNCSYDPTPAMLIPVNIRTSHLLGPKATGYECYAVKHFELKTFYFFGFHYREYSTTPVDLTLEACKQLVQMKQDFSGHPLKQLRHDYWATGLETSATYSWPITTTSTVYNYHIQRVNVTVQDDLSTIKVENTNFLKPCDFSALSCETGSRKGIVFWGSKLVMGGRPQCHQRDYKHQSCLLSATSVRCPELGIVISSLFSPYRCGVRSSFIRLTVTNDTSDTRLTRSSDFVPITADFDTLYNDTNSFYQEGLTMLAYQLAMCSEDDN